MARSDGGVKNTLSESNRGGLEYKQAPDNRGGASWFVLLAVEKNEQIKRINVTRTFFDRERKSFVSQSSLAVPRMRGIALQRAEGYSHPPPLCFAPQNIGEVSVRTEGLNPTIKKILCNLFQPLSSETTVPSVSPLYR